MGTVARIKELAKSKGITMTYLCSLVGRGRSYLTNVSCGKDRLTDDRLAIIADALGTTPEYLMGETDQKEKATGNEADDLKKELIAFYGPVDKDIDADEIRRLIDFKNAFLKLNLAERRVVMDMVDRLADKQV